MIDTKRRLLLAEDHALVGEGLAAMLSPHYNIVGIVMSGSDVISEVLKHLPDILLLDLSLPGRNGLDLLPQLTTERPSMPTLVVSMHVEMHLVAAAMRLGAAGFVPKNATIRELRTAIATVLSGKRFVSPAVPRRCHRGGLSDPVGFARLTPHQQRIVRMIGKGMHSREIAASLRISVWTVNFHRKNIRRELGIGSDLEMYRYAILVDEGVSEPDGDSPHFRTGDWIESQP